MGFRYSRRYQLDVALVGMAPWHAAGWQALLPAFQPLFDGSSGSPSVRTVQYENGKQVRFGRLRWDATSHERWTLPTGSPRTFVSTEVSAPSWGRCEREGRPPDVYLHLVDRASITGTFMPVVLLAVALDAEPTVLTAADGAMRASAEVLGTTSQRRSLRPWGRSAGGGAFTDTIGDLGLSPNLAISRPRRRRPPAQPPLHRTGTPNAPSASAQAKRLTKSSAVWATSCQPWSMVSEWPRFGTFTISVTAGLRLWRL